MHVSVRRLVPHDWRLYRELRLRALSDAPDAFGSTFAEEAEREDEEWASRLAAGATSTRDLPMVAEIDHQPAGLAWARIDAVEPGVVHVFHVWVAPERRRLGIGRALLQATDAWARSVHAQVLALDVTCGDTSAMRMYRRAGFAPVGDPQPLRPGSALQKQAMRLALEPESA